MIATLKKIYVHLFSANKLDYYLDNKYQSFNIEYDDLSPAGFYLAVSAQEFQNNIYNLDLPENKNIRNLKTTSQLELANQFLFSKFLNQK